MKKWYIICPSILILGISSGIYYFSVQRVQAMELPANIVFQTHDGDAYYFDECNGKIRLIEFIYTKCPDICPATTLHMNLLKEDLRAAGISKEQVEFLTITIDPKRDTLEVLSQYKNTFDIETEDGWVLLRGDAQDTEALAKSLEFYYQDPGNGMLSHSSFTYILNEENQVVEMYGMGNKGFDKDKIFARISKLVNQV